MRGASGRSRNSPTRDEDTMPRSHSTNASVRRFIAAPRVVAPALVLAFALGAAPLAVSAEQAAASGSPAAPARAEYRIGFGDELSIFVFGEERDGTTEVPA